MQLSVRLLCMRVSFLCNPFVLHCAGVMGLATAKALQGLGYKVSGWSRSQPDQQQQQQRSGISSYVGQQQLQEFVSQQDVVVCLLPLTPETTGGWMGGL